MTSVKAAEAPVHPGQMRPPRKEGKGHTRTSAPVVSGSSEGSQCADEGGIELSVGRWQRDAQRGLLDEQSSYVRRVGPRRN